MDDHPINTQDDSSVLKEKTNMQGQAKYEVVCQIWQTAWRDGRQPPDDRDVAAVAQALGLAISDVQAAWQARHVHPTHYGDLDKDPVEIADMFYRTTHSLTTTGLSEEAIGDVVGLSRQEYHDTYKTRFLAELDARKAWKEADMEDGILHGQIGHYARLETAIGLTKHKILLSAYDFSHQGLAETLENKLREGVRLTILADR